jgi:hypothetical protein
MDKKQAQDIIRVTFETPYDKGRFTNFIKNLLTRIKEAPFTYQGQFIPDAYKPYISVLERIGKYSDGEHKIDILVIKLKKETSLERARTMQRNFVAWYLNGSRGGELKDAALVAFIAPEDVDWRFSLVKMDYKFEQTPSGKMKVKEEFTPARRWSFLVGVNERSHTAQSRLVNILADDEMAPTLAELEEAFNIETVTKEFFLKYRDLFIRTKEALDKVVKNDDRIKADFEAKGVNTVDFAKKLLGQIVFLYFLQKKGWFGVARDATWGSGTKQFLRELFEKKHGSFNNFFNDILEPLFYEALRIGEERKQDDYYYSRFNCKIPFLNGGLFDPIGNYDWVNTDIILPDMLFSNTNKTKEGDIGDGMLDIFDRYNFTVKEDEPLEKEVAIDPELLGKAYEKFNAIRPDNFEEYKKALKSGKKGDESKFNKQFGVYYTPREIVHYMCRQSLINYLATELTDCHSRPISEQGVNSSGNPVVSKEDIETLIHLGEQVSENEARVESKGKETTTYSYKLPESIRKNAGLINRKLADITVCDPAVGSGAFPVGMMSEIVKARNILSVFIKDKNNPPKLPLLSKGGEGGFERAERTPYDFKRRCIEHSLYGVDIDPGAVEIAKLRLWLSLVVDEEDIKNIKPLPNLDYKIVCGNSLLGVEKDLFNNQLFNDLETLKPLYFNETNPTKKQDFKKQIDELISRITNGHKEFDFEVYFSEVFHQKGGFDVVIANPPYIFARESQKKGLTDRDKKYFYENYQLAEYQVNLYPLFIEKGTRLLTHNGCFCFITPNNWLTINTNKKLRKFALGQSDITIVNFYARVFESAAVDSAIIIFRKSADNRRVALYEYTNGFGFIKEVECDFFLSQRDHVINIDAFKGDGVSELLQKIESQSVPLSSIASVKAGLKAYETGTGIPPQTEAMKKNRVYHETRKIDATYLKYLDGRDVCRYQIFWSGEYLKYGVNLAAPRKDFRLYSTKRILVRQIPAKPPYCIHACLIEETALNDLNSMNIINIRESPECLLGILNSRLTSFWFIHKFGKMQRGTFPQFKVNELANFPLPNNRTMRSDEIAILVTEIITAKRREPTADTSVLEKQIDRMVYELYGLTEEEIVIVENSGKKNEHTTLN